MRGFRRYDVPWSAFLVMVLSAGTLAACGSCEEALYSVMLVDESLKPLSAARVEMTDRGSGETMTAFCSVPLGWTPEQNASHGTRCHIWSAIAGTPDRGLISISVRATVGSTELRGTLKTARVRNACDGIPDNTIVVVLRSQ